MEPLSGFIAKRGALSRLDAAGWVVRLCRQLEAWEERGEAHGAVSADAVCCAAARRMARGELLPPWRAPALAAYCSPERSEGADGTAADDAWAAAVVLYLAITGEYPFPGADHQQIQWKVLAGPPRPLKSFGIEEPALQDLFDRAFAPEVERRIVRASSLREAIDGWARGARLGDLPPLAMAPDEEADVGDEKTLVRNDPGEIKRLFEAARVEAAARSRATSTRTSVTPEEPAPATGDRVSGPPKAAPPATPSPRAAQPPPRVAKPPAPEPAKPPPAPEPAKPPPAPEPAKPPPAPEPAKPPAPQPVEPASAAPQPDRAPLEFAKAAPPPPDSSSPPREPVESPVPAAPAPLDAPPTRPRRRSGRTAAIVVFVALAGAAAVVAARPELRAKVEVMAASARERVVGSGQGARSPSTASPIPTSGAASAGATAAASIEATGAPATTGAPPASAAADASSAPAPGAPGPDGSSSKPRAEHAGAARMELGACVRALTPAGTFDAGAKFDFDFLCSERDLRKSSVAMKKRVVLAGAGRPVTDGMREWAMLGWYEMPAIAVIRGACCDAPPPAELPAIEGSTCEPLGRVLDDLAAAVAKNADAPAVDAVLERYTRSVYCAFRTGSANVFGPPRPPLGGEVSTLRKLVERVPQRGH